MDILRYVLLIVEVLCSSMLIVLILIQKTKSEGLGLAFGSGMGETLFGSRAGNILTKLTIGLAIVFLANTLMLSLLYSGARGRTVMGRIMGSPAAAQPMVPRDQSAPMQSAPDGMQAGAPTLPGVDFSGESAPAAPADAPGQP